MTFIVSPADNHGVTFRSYVRQRSRLIELSSVQIQLMNKAMIQMNIRLDQVFSEISGVSSMLIIRSIVSGERSSAILAKHRQVQCKKTEADIMKALEGNFRPEHVFSLEQSLRIYDCIQNLILECNAKIEEMLNNWYEPQNKRKPQIQAKDFHDIGQNAYEQQFEKRKIANLKRIAKEMGFVLHPVWRRTYPRLCTNFSSKFFD